jgi:transcriptional regulator with XRE-family HTH domain
MAENHIGNKLRALRRLAGENLCDVANRWGKSVSYVSSVENGFTLPSPSEILLAAKANLAPKLLKCLAMSKAIPREQPKVYNEDQPCQCGKPPATFCPRHCILQDTAESIQG